MSVPALSLIRKFPVEVWEECWSHLNARDLQELCLVCQLFRSLCQPRIFHHLDFSSPYPEDIGDDDWEDEARSLLKSASRFKHLADSDVRHHVRSWDFSGFCEEILDSDEFDIQNTELLLQAYHCAVQAFILSLGSFSDLRSICCNFIDVTPRLLDILASLPRLDELSLHSCLVVGQTANTLSIRTLCIGDISWIDETPTPIPLVSSRTLESLTMGSYKGALRLLPPLLSNGTFSNLVHFRLILPASIHNIFFDILRTCSNLHTLDIESPDAMNNHYILPSDVIPSLRVYRGPLSLAESLVAGRPVHEVHLGTNHGVAHGRMPVSVASLLSTFSWISGTSVALRDLKLPLMYPNFEVFHAVAKLFPCLVNLTITVLGNTKDEPTGPQVPHDREEGSSSVPTGTDASKPVFLHIPNGDGENPDFPNRTTSSIEVSTVALNEDGLPVRTADSFTVRFPFLFLRFSALMKR